MTLFMITLTDCPKYHPAGYSSEYSAGTILLLIKQKIRHYGQIESYFTQLHTKVFQNIKLAFLYSKSVSRENSKCFDFASLEVKHIVQNRPSFSLMPDRLKK